MSDLDAIITMIIAITTGNSAMMGLFLGILIFSIILGLIFIISYWKIFNKAGKPGIASIIPIYNSVVMVQIAKLSLIYIFLLLIPVVNIFAIFKINVEIAKRFGKTTGFGVGITLLPIIFVPLLAFSDNTYDNIQTKDEENNSLNNVQYNVNIINENIVKNLDESIETLQNDKLVDNASVTEHKKENENSVQEINSELTSDEITENQNTSLISSVDLESTNIEIPVENVVSDEENIVTEQESVIENIVNTEIKEDAPILNAFNSKPINFQQENIVTPSLDLKINTDNTLNPSENTSINEDILTNSIEESVRSETETFNTNKVCKSCGETLPNIVSICPKCGTDNE